MRRYLFDTNHASDYINRRRRVYDRACLAASQGDRIGLCPPVLGELYAGIELSASREENRKILKRDLNSLHIWPFDEAAAEEFGRLFARLRKAGRPMQQIDIQIAAVALSLGKCTVVSTDSDFSAIPGLKVESWVS